MNSRQKTLLYVGLISAILILLIACLQLYQSQLLLPIATSADDPYGKTDGSDKKQYKPPAIYRYIPDRQLYPSCYLC